LPVLSFWQKRQRSTVSRPAASQGNLYQNAPVWNWNDIDVVIVDYLTEAKSAAGYAAGGAVDVPDSGAAGIRVGEAGLGPLPGLELRHPTTSSCPVIPFLFNGQMFLDVPLIYVDNDAAMAGGREIRGVAQEDGQNRVRPRRGRISMHPGAAWPTTGFGQHEE
jgi:hypothetical protein